MKKIYFLLLCCITLVSASYGQGTTVIARQGFEGLGNWDVSIVNPTNGTNRKWGEFTSLSTPSGITPSNTITPISPDGGSEILAYNNRYGSGSPGTAIFSSIDVSTFTEIAIAFQLQYSTNADPRTVTGNAYLLIDEGLATEDEIAVNFLAPATTPGTYEVLIFDDIPENISSIGVTIQIASTDRTALIGLDNFTLLGSTDDFVGLVYDESAYTDPGNGWRDGLSPSTGTSDANAIVINGTYIVDQNVRLNNLTVSGTGNVFVENDAWLWIGQDLITDDNLTVDSTSDSYGCLYVNGISTGMSTYNLWVKEDGINDLITAPVFGEAFENFAARNDSKLVAPISGSSQVKKFGPFDKNTGQYLQWDTSINGGEMLTTGTGYRAATLSSTDQKLSFKGNNHTTNINIPVVHSPGSIASQWNLIGNPYTAYIQVSDFVDLNVDEFQPGKGGVYAYNGTNWTVYNASSPNLMRPGQGFYVGVLNNTTMGFRRYMRTLANVDDFIAGRTETETETPKNITLKLTSKDEEKHITQVYFNNKTSLGQDEGYDTTIYSNNSSGFTMFTQLADNSEFPNYKLAIQTLPETALDNDGTAIPLGIIAPKGQQITIDIKENSLNESATIYLEDTKTNTWTLLNNEPYTITTEEKLSGLGRFILHVSDQDRLSIEEDNVLNSIQVFSGQQSIKLKGQLQTNTKLDIFDLQGRQIYNTTLKQTVNEYTISAPNLGSGIYIVRIENNTGNQISKRVILK